MLREAYWAEPVTYGDYRAETVMGLLEAGSIDILLRVAASPYNEQLRRLHQMPGPDPGWGQVWRNALTSYTFLNITYCTTRPTDPSAIPRIPDDRAYRRMLSVSTSFQDGDRFAWPHRVFYFGAADGTKGDLVLTWDRETLAKMRDYHKRCWESVVLAAVLVDALGLDIDWAEESRWAVERLWG